MSKFWDSLRDLASGLPNAEVQDPDPIEVPDPSPDRWSYAYAYSPRESRRAHQGRVHVVTNEDLSHGRLKRRKGEVLCRPSGKKFWGLQPRTLEEFEASPCQTCLARLNRIEET